MKVMKNEDKIQQAKEYVLDPKLPPLTLAQKFGLVCAPKPLLSEHEWENVKAKSNQRDDSKEPCVICKEDFGLQEQVILSCTHVFHRACLQALERFTGRKTCPMCRHQHYQTRVIQEGARVYKHRCATRIQSLWRGYVVRCWYKQLRETVPPKDPLLKKKFYEEKLSAIVDRIVKSVDVNMAEFLREIDTSVQQSRAVFSQWDAIHNFISPDQWEAIQLKAVERGESDCPICLTELCLTDSLSDSCCPTQELSTNSNTQTSHSRTSYSIKSLKSKSQNSRNISFSASDKHKSREDHFNTSNIESSNSGDTEPTKCLRSTVLLSCTHVFHSTCLKTLEEIAMQDMKYTCPVCRAYYKKKVIVF